MKLKKKTYKKCFNVLPVPHTEELLVRYRLTRVRVSVHWAQPPKPNCKTLGKQKKGGKGVQQHSREQRVLQPLGTPPLDNHPSVPAVVTGAGGEGISPVPYVPHPSSQLDCSARFFCIRKKCYFFFLLVLEECLLNRENNYLPFLSTLLTTSPHSYNLTF